MSRNYKFKSLQIAEIGGKAKNQENNSNPSNAYMVGETRTIDFKLHDGTRQYFPYSHMLTCWFGKKTNKSVIKIFFATHLVTIEGYCLKEVYELLTEQRLKSLKALDIRYLQTGDMNNLFVSNITIEWKGERDN